MRVLTQVWCPSSKRHKIGTVCADEQGLFISYTAEVWHTTGIFGSREHVIDRLDDDIAELGGFCRSCKKVVQLARPALRAAALAGTRQITMPFAHTADHVFVDAGYPAMYPPSIPRDKTDPR